MAPGQWQNTGTVTPATPGAPSQGGAKLHEYLFSKIILKDGQRTKVFGGITEPELTTVDGQKIIRGITKADFTTVDGQKIIGGAKSLVGAPKGCQPRGV